MFKTKSLDEVKQEEFIKGCFVSMNMTFEESVPLDELLNGCIKLEKSFRKLEEEHEEEKENPNRYEPRDVPKDTRAFRI